MNNLVGKKSFNIFLLQFPNQWDKDTRISPGMFYEITD